MTERTVVDLGDDVRLAVTVRGTGPVLVLLHGFTGDASTMDELADRFAADRTVVMPDLPGHGDTVAPPEAHTVDAMAAQVVAMVAALGHPAPFDLVGYSMGGRVALTAACAHPDAIGSLALIGASAGLAGAEERVARQEADDALAAAILADGVPSFVDRWMANPLFATQSRLGDAALAGFRAQRLRNDGLGLATSLRAAGTGRMRPLHDDLHRACMPVCLVVGVDDPKFRGIAADLASALPAATIATIDDAGHAAHLEQPDACAAAIRQGVDGVVVTRHEVDLELGQPLVTGRSWVERRSSVLVSMRADGVTGWGDAAPLPGWSTASLDDVRASLAGRVRFEDGASAWDASAAWRDAQTTTEARAAVAGAAIDLDARRAGVRLADHLVAWHPDLHDAPFDTVEVNALVGDAEPSVVAVQVAAAAAAGITTIKIKVGAGAPDRDVARLLAAREAAPSMVLRIDANGAWDTATAVAVLGAVAPLGIAGCEEPVPGIDAMLAVADTTDVPIVVDESARTVDDIEAVLDHADRLGGVVVKPQALGGPDRAVDAIVAARAAGLSVMVTSMIDNAVGRAHALHVAAACRLEGAHGLHTGPLLVADVGVTPGVEGGRMPLPNGPGLGIGLVSPVGAGWP